MIESKEVDKICKHHNWVPAGYPQGEYIRVQSIYEVYCFDCNHFIYLLDGTIIDGKGLVKYGNTERRWEGFRNV